MKFSIALLYVENILYLSSCILKLRLLIAELSKMASKVQCKYHPDANLIEDYRAGDQICSECGIVVGDR